MKAPLRPAALPRPTGPHAVGSVCVDLHDPSRPIHLRGSLPGRRLRLKMWYPARLASNAKPERLWAELDSEPRPPFPVRWMLGLLRRPSHSHAGAACAAAVAGAPVVLYSHGFISFASENTSLMEDLASQGYVVVALRHIAQLEELRALQGSQSVTQRGIARDLERQIVRGSAADRARLARAYYEASSVTAQIVRERAADCRFVLDRLGEVLGAIPGRDTGSKVDDAVDIHLVGYSVGGAVSTEVALHDVRARSIVNLDGGTQGSVDATSLRSPYLMLYSAANEGINDALLPPSVRRACAPGSAHLNFHDLAGLLPSLRWVGALGKTDSRDFLFQRNAQVREFLESLPPT